MINKVMFSSNTAEWATPQAFFDELNKEFDFTLDPCATQQNAKCARYFTKEVDGLAQVGAAGGYFAIRLTGGTLANGLKKPTTKRLRGGVRSL